MAKAKKTNGFLQFILFIVMSLVAFAFQMAIVTFGDDLLIMAGVNNSESFTAWIFGEYTTATFVAFLVGNIVAKIVSYILNRKKTFAATNNLAFSFSMYIIMCVALIIAETLIGEPLGKFLVKNLPEDVWTLLNTTSEAELINPNWSSTMAMIIYSIADFIIVFLMEKFIIMNNNLFKDKSHHKEDDEDTEEVPVAEEAPVAEEVTEEAKEEVVEEPVAEEVAEEETPIEETKEEEVQEEPAKEEVVEEPVAAEEPAQVVAEAQEEPVKAAAVAVGSVALDDAVAEKIDTISEQLKEQNKLNASINDRLDRLDKNIQLIADILRGLAVDGVAAGVSSIAVPVEDTTEAVVEDTSAFEQPEEETPVETPVEEEVAAEEDDSWIANADTNVRIKPKLSFDMRLRVASDDVKKFYSDIKNELLSYGIHSRVSRHRENFNQGRINICRIVINGKTLKVYLAVDPTSIDARYYHHEDVGYRKGLVDLPTMINVRSKVAARKVRELIGLIMESLVISKKNYEPYDFAQDLTMEGLTTVQCKGFDYLCKDEVTCEEANNYPDTFASDLIEVVEDSDYQERYIKTHVTLDDLVKNFNDGDVVDIDAVREKDLGPVNSNFLSVTESDKLSKKLKVYAHELTPNAVKMICLAGGEVFVVVQPEKAE